MVLSANASPPEFCGSRRCRAPGARRDRRGLRRRSSSGTPGTPGSGGGRAASRSPDPRRDPGRRTDSRCRAGHSRGWPAPGCPAASGTPAAVRLSAWIWVFSSTQSTSARSGGSRYSPTTSRTFSTNSGSLDSFHESCLCGANPNARQTRETIDWLNPRCSAIDRVDQCVASGGVLSNVVVINALICSSPTTRGRPGRGSSSRPSQRNSTNRLRQRCTVFRSRCPADAASRYWTHHRRLPTRFATATPTRRTRATPRPALQLGTLIIGQHNLGSMRRRHSPV